MGQIQEIMKKQRARVGEQAFPKVRTSFPFVITHTFPQPLTYSVLKERVWMGLTD